MEATVRLNLFHSKTRVREILAEQGFALTDLSSNRVRVKGSFRNLKAVKDYFEALVNFQTKMDISPPSSSPVPTTASGSVSKYYTDRSDANTSRLGSPSSPTSFSSWVSGPSDSSQARSRYNTSFSPTPGQSDSLKTGKQFFVIDGDVFDYAKKLWKKDIENILHSHNVTMEAFPVGDSYNITLQGKNARAAVGELQGLLDGLSKSLRTQEVLLKDMNPEGKALLERTEKKGNINHSVLICPKNDRLHLIGPSNESYELKQKLLGRPVHQSGRTGRSVDRNRGRRSSSLPPMSRKDTERDSSVAATGYSPTKYQDIKQKVAEPEWGTDSAPLSQYPRKTSQFGSRCETPAGRTEGIAQDRENKTLPPKLPKKDLPQLLLYNTEDLRQRFRNVKK